MTADELRQKYPEIAWDEPVRITVGTDAYWTCRICIALNGLRAAEIARTPFAFTHRSTAEGHILQEHG
jgi:hypothetical protein